jgi:general secretion pathway protein D
MTDPCASRTTWLRKTGATTVAAALLLGSMPMRVAVAQTASAARFRGEPVTLNFVNAEIEGVARAMSAILRQQFVVDPRVRGTITLYSEEALTPREAYFNFLAALRGLGFTWSRSTASTRSSPRPTPSCRPERSTSAAQAGAATDPDPDLSPQPRERQQPGAGAQAPDQPEQHDQRQPGNNTLVITDYADNLQRIGKIIAAMDVPRAATSR